ncbi:MAG: GNAT family N-acetyltransferase [Planctomycetota bacterium]|nr:GNAT family N-acetyltransferase [Planctomycetota bacterium]
MAFLISEALAEDVAALPKLHVQTFNETHCDGRARGPSFELRERQWREAYAAADGAWFCFVVEDDAGHWSDSRKGTPHKGGVPGAGELNKIYVLRQFHRQGIGRLLVCHVARRFLSAASRRCCSSAMANPSNGFYEAFGAERLYSPSGEFHGGYGWRDLHQLFAKACGE